MTERETPPPRPRGVIPRRNTVAVARRGSVTDDVRTLLGERAMGRILPAGAGGSRPASPPRRLATVAGAPAAPAATTTATTTHARAVTFHATAWLDTLDLSFTDNDKTPRPAAATTALRIDPHSGDIDDDGDASGGDSPRVWSPNPLFTDRKNDHDDDARAENTAVQTRHGRRRGSRDADEAAAAAALAALLRCVLCIVGDTAAPPDEESPAEMTPAPPPPAWVTVRDVENNDDESLNPLLPQKSEEKTRHSKHSCAASTRLCANVAAVALALVLGVVVPIHSLITGTELGADGSDGLGVTRASVSMKLLILLASHWTLQVTLCAPKHGGLTHTTFLTDAFGGFAPKVHRRRVHAAYAQIVRSQTRKEWRMLLLPFIVAKLISSAFAMYGWYSVSSHTQSSSLANGRDVMRWAWAIGDVCSDVFCAASFALVCSVFRVACALTLLRLNSLFVMIQNLGATRVDGGSPALDETNDNSTEDDFEDHPANDDDDESGSHCRCISGIEAIVEEHASLRGLVRKLAHSFRVFLVVSSLGCLGESFAFCFHVAVGDSFNGTHMASTWTPRAVPSALRLALHTWGVALNLRAATLATHRMQKTGVYLSERHARMTSYPLHFSDSNSNSMTGTYRGVVRHERRMEAFAAGQAAVGYFRDDRLGISVFGFALDREFLRTFHTALVALVLFVATRALTARH